MLRAVFLFLALMLPGISLAQDRPSAILVLDASGSMWGQIEGVNKIVIARDVVGDLLGTLPEDQALGLVAYGHRRKGDCSDIELLYEPGTDRAAIGDAVMSLNPKGKTPLSAAVIQAAEALRYTEDTATVILVSDGIETCDYDPCEVGRQLEETGVNFTAHVIGFDVADPAAQAQLQCLADETGGLYRSASDAGELSEALSEVAIAEPEPIPEPEPAPEPEPEPIEASVTFVATNGPNGPEEVEGISWAITAGDTTLADGLDEVRPSFMVDENTAGRATATRALDGATATVSFTTKPTDITVTLALPVLLPPATVEAPASAPAGSLVKVTFTGPEAEDDFIASATAAQKDGYYTHYTYTRDAEEGSVMLRLPPDTGTAEIRYMLGNGSKVLARTEIEVTPLDITLTPPDEVTIGMVPEITWTGPNYEGDYVTVSALDQGDAYYKTYAYTRDGSPLAIQMPGEPGTYELRYVLGASRAVAARSVAFEVADSAVSLSGPAQAVAGSDIEVTWNGPDALNDYIGIGRVDGDRPYMTYSYTRQGDPLTVKTPIEPGDYEIRYFLGQNQSVLASIPLTLTEPTASLSAPDSATAGSELIVDWTGPGYQSDYLAVSLAGSEDTEYVTYNYTRVGNPLGVMLPTEPGDYEIRYVANASPDVVLARKALTITAATATLDSAVSAPVGSTLAVTWTGPGLSRDFLSIAEAGSKETQYVTYAYVQNGSPTEITLPATPGTYELRYILNGTPDRLLASVPLEVTEADAALSYDITDDGIVVTWEGPGYHNDYISLAEAGTDPKRYVEYSYVRRGNPVTIALPESGGDYELRYILDGNVLRVLTSEAISLP